MRTSLAFLRKTNKISKGIVDGWQLIHVALAAIRELAPDSWIHSFDKVNLKPSTRVGFDEWCKRIEHYLQVFPSRPLGPSPDRSPLPYPARSLIVPAPPPSRAASRRSRQRSCVTRTRRSHPTGTA